MRKVQYFAWFWRSEEMDDTDRKLMVLISENPRMNSRELAKRLGISRQAVHHRMQVLTKIGVFKSLKAEISFHYLDAVIVGVWGRFKAAPVEEVMDKLGESEFTSSVRVAGGNELFVMGGLRNVSELDSYVEFVKRAAEMPEPTVGIMCFGDGINPDYYDGGKRKQTYKDLSPLDLKIIASLQDDARKPTAEIANSIGVSAKTVRRHLENMASNGSLDFYSPWDLTSGEDMSTLIYVNLKSGADKVRAARRLLSKDPIHLIYMRSFSNLPSFLIGLICSDKMSEIRKILGKIGEDEDVLSMTPNLLYFERSYTTWDHKLLAVLTRPSEKAKKHQSHPGAKTR
jgi:DNA-binding Lrp family transcriptional regulator